MVIQRALEGQIVGVSGLAFEIKLKLGTKLTVPRKEGFVYGDKVWVLYDYERSLVRDYLSDYDVRDMAIHEEFEPIEDEEIIHYDESHK